ncbi:hypothetical protein TNCT1_15280 [Streptomyces sp. 1-11]|nr:hypothetical protein TNCT1_15280 [Streptomyces sp. 1-11]
MPVPRVRVRARRARGAGAPGQVRTGLLGARCWRAGADARAWRRSPALRTTRVTSAAYGARHPRCERCVDRRAPAVRRRAEGRIVTRAALVAAVASTAPARTLPTPGG